MVPQQNTQQPGQLQDISVEGVRLTKDGVPRKKPGRKPGTTVTKKASDGTPPSMSATTATASGSGVEAAKQKRPRKPKDLNAPPVARKKRSLGSDLPDSIGGTGPSRSSSANMHFEPKVELTSMRMDIDSRPAQRSLGPSAILHHHPRPPPLPVVDKAPKREPPTNSVMSILNAEDSPPRPAHTAPTSTTPVRSVGQSYDPIRSSTYDPVRETMMSRDPYGTGPLGSPRAPTHITNRATLLI
ncbi:HIR complex subunit [Sporothrix curviconia]|uniref:HIR complex subunit n=1 Tax=Sporothrix curviconia TaxID=1260050 RepID=A0ABP0B413_9PEZI